MVECALKAREILAPGIGVQVVNARFVKPLDEEMLDSLRSSFKTIITVEENTLRGGFGSAVDEYFRSTGAGDIRILPIGIPDTFIRHGSRALLLEDLGLVPEALAERVSALIPAKKTKVTTC